MLAIVQAIQNELHEHINVMNTKEAVVNQIDIDS